MKLYHKQLLLLLFFFSLIFGVAGYFHYSGMDVIITDAARPVAEFTAARLRVELTRVLEQAGFETGWRPQDEKQTREYFLEKREEFASVKNFIVITKELEIAFSLNSHAIDGNTIAEIMSGYAASDSTAVSIGAMAGSYRAIWPLGSSSLLAITLIDSKYYIRDALGSLSIRLYLVAFAAFLGVIFIAMVMTRSIKTPLASVERAMMNIDKRKYGYRIKSKQADEFKEFYQKVNQALTRLEQLDSVQRTAVQRKNTLLRELKTISRFMGIMSHEVKNPLHALVINIDVLKSKIQKGRAKTEALKHVEIIEREIEHVRKVIDGFLSYVRPGVPQKERIKVNELVKEVSQTVLADAEKNNVKIETRLGKGLNDISADRGHLLQAMHNVILNAIHACRNEGKILIRTFAKGKKMSISVKDDGIGISKEELKRIFDLYYTTKKQGSGIGLPITRRVVETNGGLMQLDSKLDKGTTVTFTFTSI